MSFETPAALWGLLSLVLLAIFSLWRQAAVRAVVPSLLLWKRIPERNPPIRALRRPAWRWELLLQAIAAALLVAGLAGPVAESDVPKPRRIALVVDTSARMAAGDRLERVRRRIAALLAGELRHDEVVLHVADPAPRTLRRSEDLRQGGGHVDLAPLLALARAGADHVALFSDRDPDGLPGELLGGPAGNVGIVGLTATDGEVFARLANHGPARTVGISLNGTRETLALAAGETAWSKKADFSKLDRLDLELETGDAFAADDRAGAVRLAPARAEVGVRGLSVPLLDRALASVPGVALRPDAARPAVAVGVDEEPGPGEVRVLLRSPAPRVEPASVDLVPHALTRGLKGSELRTAGVGALPPGGEPLATADGRAVLGLRGGVIEASVSFDPRHWPATASWPIFWENVVDFARKGRGAFVVPRVGTPLSVPADVAGVRGGPSVLPPSREFVPAATGMVELDRSGEPRSFVAGLLDERESDAAGSSRALDLRLGPASGRERTRRPLGAWAALGALACVVGAWWLQRRSST